MVFIVEEERKPKFSERIAEGLSKGLQLLAQHDQRQKENAFAKKLGLDLEGVRDPETRNKLLVEAQKANFKNQQIQQKQAMLSSLLGPQGQQGYQADQFGAPPQPKSFLNQLQGSGQQPQPSQFGQSQQTQYGQPFEQAQGFDQPGFEFQEPSYDQDQSQQPPRYFRYSPEQILQASMMDPNLARTMQAQEEADAKRFHDQQSKKFDIYKLNRQEETEISKPILLELNTLRKNIPLQEQAIADIKEASPNVNFRDFFAEVTGFEPIRTAEGAKLKSAIKDFFLSDLTRAGSRPNQWIEQQLADALPKIGRSTEANLVTAAGMNFRVDVAKKRIELLDQLASQDRKKFGFVKGDIDSRADKMLKPYLMERQKQLKNEIKDIKQTASKKVRVRSPDGKKTYEIDAKDLKEALKNNYEQIK